MQRIVQGQGNGGPKRLPEQTEDDGPMGDVMAQHACV